MCWKKKKPVVVPPPPPPPPPVLPHPEEPVNEAQTVANTDLSKVFNQWISSYKVPEQYAGYWYAKTNVQLFDQWPDYILAWPGVTPTTPGFSFELNGRNLYFLAKWFNPGVYAHEHAHDSYALLSEVSTFSAVYGLLKETDPMIKYLYSIHPYGLKNDIEGHAEVYRFLGEQMPEELKKFYPKLFADQ